MSRDGSGTMSIPYPSFTSGTTISSSQVNSNNSTIVDELTNSIPRDGQAAPTANIPFGGFKITNIGSGSAATDSANLGQIQAQAYVWCGTAGGTKNALTLSPSPAITAYAAGQVFRFQAGSTQSDSTVTVAVSGLTTKAIYNNGAALSSTIYIEASKFYEIIYDGTQFELNKIQTPIGSALSVASLTASGNVSAAALIPTSGTIPTAGLFTPSAGVTGIAISGAEAFRSATGGIAIGKSVATVTTAGAYFSTTSNNICLTAGNYFIINRPDADILMDFRKAGTSYGTISVNSSNQIVANIHNTAKAWAVIEYSAGTPSATASHNVSSVTDNAGGDGTVNFTTALSSSTFVGVGTNATSSARNVYVARTSTSSSRYVVESGSDDSVALVWYAAN